MPRPDNRRGRTGGLTRPTPNVTPVFEETAGMQAPDLAIPETIARRQQGSEQRGQYSFGDMRPPSQNAGAELLEGLANAGSQGLDFLQRVQNRLAKNNEKDLKLEQDKINNGRYHVTVDPVDKSVKRTFIDDPERLSQLYEDPKALLQEATSQEKIAMFDLNTQKIQGKGFYFSEMRDAISSSFGADDWETYLSGKLNEVDVIFSGPGNPSTKLASLEQLERNAPAAVIRKIELARARLSQDVAQTAVRTSVAVANTDLRKDYDDALSAARDDENYTPYNDIIKQDLGDLFNIDALLTDDQLKIIRSFDADRTEKVLEQLEDFHVDTVLAYQSALQERSRFVNQIKRIQADQEISREATQLSNDLLNINSTADLEKVIRQRNNHHAKAGSKSRFDALSTIGAIFDPFAGRGAAQRIAEGRGLIATFNLQATYDSATGTQRDKIKAVIEKLKDSFAGFPADEQDFVDTAIDNLNLEIAIKAEISSNNVAITGIGDDALMDMEIEDQATSLFQMELAGEQWGLTRTQMTQPYSVISGVPGAPPIPDGDLGPLLDNKTIAQAFGIMLAEQYAGDLTPDEQSYFEEIASTYSRSLARTPAEIEGVFEQVIKRLGSIDRSMQMERDRGAKAIGDAVEKLQDAQQTLSDGGINNGVTESLEFMFDGKRTDNPFNQQVGIGLVETARGVSVSEYQSPRDPVSKKIDPSKDPAKTFGSSAKNTPFSYDFFADIGGYLFDGREIPFAAAMGARENNPDLVELDHVRISKRAGITPLEVQEDFILFDEGRRIMSTYGRTGEPLSDEQYATIGKMMDALQVYYERQGDRSATGRFIKEKERLLFVMNPDPTAFTLNAAEEAGLDDIAMTMYSLAFEYMGDPESFNNNYGKNSDDPNDVVGLYAATQAGLPQVQTVRGLLLDNPDALPEEQREQLIDQLAGLSTTPQHHQMSDKARTALLDRFLNFVKDGSGEGVAGNVNPEYVQRRLDLARSLFITVDKDPNTGALSISPARLTLEIAANQLELDNPDGLPSPTEVRLRALDMLANTSSFMTAVANYLPNIEGANSDAEVQGYGILAAYFSAEYRRLTGEDTLNQADMAPALARALTTSEKVTAGEEQASNRRGPNAFVLQVSEADLLEATRTQQGDAVGKAVAVIDLAVEDLANYIAMTGGFSIREQEGAGLSVKYTARDSMTGATNVVNNNFTWNSKTWVPPEGSKLNASDTTISGLTTAGVDVTRYLYEQIKKRGNALMKAAGLDPTKKIKGDTFFYALAAQRLWKQTVGGDMVYFDGTLPNMEDERDFTARANLRVNKDRSRGELNARVIGGTLARNLASTEVNPLAQARALLGDDSNYTPLGMFTTGNVGHQGAAEGRVTSVVPFSQLVTDSKGNREVRTGFAPKNYNSPPWKALTGRVMQFGLEQENPHAEGTAEYRQVEKSNERLTQEQVTQPRQIANGLSIYLSDDGQDLPLNLERELSIAILPTITGLMTTIEDAGTSLEMDPFSFSMATHISVLKMHPAAISGGSVPATSPLFTELEMARNGSLTDEEKTQVHAAMVKFARTIASVHSDLGIKDNYYTDPEFDVLYGKQGDETTRYSYGFTGNPYPLTVKEGDATVPAGTPFGPWGIPSRATGKTLRSELSTTSDTLSWGQQLTNGRLFWSDRRHQELNDNGTYVIHSLNNSRQPYEDGSKLPTELPFPVFIGGTIEARSLRGN